MCACKFELLNYWNGKRSSCCRRCIELLIKWIETGMWLDFRCSKFYDLFIYKIPIGNHNLRILLVHFGLQRMVLCLKNKSVLIRANCLILPSVLNKKRNVLVVTVFIQFWMDFLYVCLYCLNFQIDGISSYALVQRVGYAWTNFQCCNCEVLKIIRYHFLSIHKSRKLSKLIMSIWVIWKWTRSVPRVVEKYQESSKDVDLKPEAFLKELYRNQKRSGYIWIESLELRLNQER